MTAGKPTDSTSFVHVVLCNVTPTFCKIWLCRSQVLLSLIRWCSYSTLFYGNIRFNFIACFQLSLVHQDIHAGTWTHGHGIIPITIDIPGRWKLVTQRTRPPSAPCIGKQATELPTGGNACVLDLWHNWSMYLYFVILSLSYNSNIG